MDAGLGEGEVTLLRMLRMENSTREKQNAVDYWNRIYPVGTHVTVRLDLGEVKKTRTRSMAELLGGHTPVVWLDGIAGCYLLERVAPDKGDG
jgi:hypothetical protein